MKTANMKQQKGFTLIELIIVIIILGILAVTAAPKFLDIQDDARESALAGIDGAVRSGSQIAHSANLITSGNSVTLEGETFTTEDTYLVAGEICRVIGLLDKTVVATLTDPDTQVASPATSVDGGYTCTLAAAATDADGATMTIESTGTTACNVIYEDTTDANDSLTRPTITSDLTCDS